MSDQGLHESLERAEGRRLMAIELAGRDVHQESIEILTDVDYRDGGYWVAARVWVDMESVEHALGLDGIGVGARVHGDVGIFFADREGTGIVRSLTSAYEDGGLVSLAGVEVDGERGRTYVPTTMLDLVPRALASDFVADVNGRDARFSRTDDGEGLGDLG